MRPFKGYLNFACPDCGAAESEWCKTWTGRRAKRAHVNRQKLADEHNEKRDGEISARKNVRRDPGGQLAGAVL